MANRFNFGSPGAAFVDEITRVLAERKAEERQQLLDNIAVAADRRQQQETESQLRWRDAQMQGQKLQEQFTKLGAVAGNMSMGDDPAAMGVDPELIETGKKYGFWKPQPTPSVSTDITGMSAEGAPLELEQGAMSAPTPTPTPRLGYVGSDKERERQRKAVERGNTLAEMLASGDPEKVNIATMLAQAANLNDGEIPDSMLGYLAPARPTQVFNEETGTFTQGPAFAPGTNVIQRGYRPRYSQGDTTINKTGTSARGFNIYQRPDGSEFEGDIQVNDPNADPLGIPVGIVNKLVEDQGLLDPRPNRVLPGESPPTEANIRAYKARAISAVQAANNVSPKVRQLAQIYVMNPAQGKMLEKTVELDATEQMQLNRLRQLVAPDHYLPVLSSTKDKVNIPKVQHPAEQVQPSGTGPDKPRIIDNLLLPKK